MSFAELVDRFVAGAVARLDNVDLLGVIKHPALEPVLGEPARRTLDLRQVCDARLYADVQPYRPRTLRRAAKPVKDAATTRREAPTAPRRKPARRTPIDRRR